MLRAFVLLFLTTCLIIGAAWFMMERQPGTTSKEDDRAAQGFLTTRQHFNDQIEEYKRKKSEATTQIDRLGQRQKAAARRMRDAGVETAADLEKNQAAQLDYSELKELKTLVSKLNEDIRSYDDAIVRMEAGLREIDRRQLAENVAISDADYEKLRIIVEDLNERLLKPDTGLEQLETQKSLDEFYEMLDDDS